MPLFDLDVATDRARRDIVLDGTGERQPNVGEELAVVPPERQHVVALARHDLGGDLFLTAHRVDRHDRLFQVENLQQLRDGRDLVRLLVGGDLPERDAAIRRPGAHDVQRPQAVLLVVRAAQRLAVDGDATRTGGRVVLVRQGQSAEPLAEAVLEQDGVEQTQHAPKRILAGDAVRQGQMLSHGSAC